MTVTTIEVNDIKRLLWDLFDNGALSYELLLEFMREAAQEVASYGDPKFFDELQKIIDRERGGVKQ